MTITSAHGDYPLPIFNSLIAACKKNCFISGVALFAIALIAAGALSLVLHVHPFAGYALLGAGSAFLIADLTAIAIASIRFRRLSHVQRRVVA